MSDDLDGFGDEEFGDEPFLDGGFGDNDPDGLESSAEGDDDAMGDAWLAANDPDAGADEEPAEQASGENIPTATNQSSSGDDPDTEALLAALGLGDLVGDADPTPPEALGADGAQLAWRETYYVLFSGEDRPTLTQVEGILSDSGRSLQIENLHADEDGLFQSVLVQSPGDSSALEISYERGDAVIEQSAELAKALQETVDGDQLAQLLRADARLDIMHFERIEPGEEPEAEDPEAMSQSGFDPATLITVVEALAHLTGGLPVDPAAGELLI